MPHDRLINLIHTALIINPVYSQAFAHLISSGRLSEQHTDVTPYTVDGRVHLAQVSNRLHRHYNWTPSFSQDGGGASKATLTLNTSHQLALQPY